MRVTADFRACLDALVSHFAKDTALAETLPEGPIDEQTFRYLVQKCGLVAEFIEKQPPLEMGIPFVAVYDDGRNCFVRFPQDGLVEVIDAEGRKTSSLEGFELDGSPLHYISVSRRNEVRAELNIFSKYAWFWDPILRNTWSYVQVCLGSLMTNVLTLSTSIFMMVVYDRIIPNKSYDSLMALTIGVAVAVIMDFVIKHLRTHMVETVGQQIDMDIGRRLFDKLFETKLEVIQGGGGIGSVSTIFREAEEIREFFTSSTLTTLIDIPFTLLFIVVIYIMAGALALVPMVCVPLVIGFGWLLQPMMRQKAADSFNKGRSKQSVVVETLGGLETLRTFSSSNFMRRRWMEGITQQANAEKGNRLMANSAISFTSFIQQVSQVAVVVVGVILMDDNSITMGGLIGAVMLTARAVAPLAQLAQMLVRLNHVRIAFASVDRMMKAPTTRNLFRHYTRRPVMAGQIEFRNVSFTYPGQPQVILHNVSFKINVGEKVAILGKVGSGKSTITKLILGLYQPTEGAILVDNIDVRQIDPVDLQSNMTALLQDVWLFTGSVRENITIGLSGASDDDMLRAAYASTAHDFVAANPLGYDLPVGERGAFLSGGQRQTVGLARTLIRKAPIIVLDEPTSSMDAATENAFISRSRDAIANRTMIMITHRNSILEMVDRVIVIDQGRVVRDGPKSILTETASQPA